MLEEVKLPEVLSKDGSNSHAVTLCSVGDTVFSGRHFVQWETLCSVGDPETTAAAVAGYS